jgi:hypothetical protein
MPHWDLDWHCLLNVGFGVLLGLGASILLARWVAGAEEDPDDDVPSWPKLNNPEAAEFGPKAGSPR